MKTRKTSYAQLLPVVLLGLLGTSCRPSGTGPLPPEEDLYVYCVAVAERARALVPESEAVGLYYLGRVEERFGLEDKALEIFREALEADPYIVDVYRQIGFILSQRNERHPEAIQAYQQGLRVDPDAGGMYTRIGLIYLHQNRLEEAEGMFREEIRRESANANTYYNLGQTLALEKKPDEAIAAYQSALLRDPHMRMAHYALSQALTTVDRLDEAEEALEEFRNLKKMEDESRVDSELGSSNREDQLRHTGDTWMDAALLFLEGRNKSPSAARRSELGKEFLHATSESLRFDASNPRPRNAMISYYRMQEDFQKAGEICEELLEVAPSKDAVPVAYELAGLNLNKLSPGNKGDAETVDLAFRLLARVAELAPRFADAHRELAKLILFYRKDRRDLLPSALKHSLEAVQLDPSARNYDVAAYAYHASGRFVEARQLLEDAVRAHPEDESLQSRLGRYENLPQR